MRLLIDSNMGLVQRTWTGHARLSSAQTLILWQVDSL